MKTVDRKWVLRQLEKSRDIAAAISVLEVSMSSQMNRSQRQIVSEAFIKATGLVKQFEALADSDGGETRWKAVDQSKGGGAEPIGSGGRVARMKAVTHRGVGEGDAGLYGEPVE
jgi:hypothetical protein